MSELVTVIENLVRDLGAIGGQRNGGVTRVGFSEHEQQAMEFVRKRIEPLGMVTEYDPIGQLAGIWNPLSSSLPPVMIGSHLDSVANGGCYDGAAGVVCAVAAIWLLRSEGFVPQRPIRLQVFSAEEGSRFPRTLLGSHAIVHGLSSDDLTITDEAGIALAAAIESSTGNVIRSLPPLLRGEDVSAFLEVHIEQGLVLVESDLSIGIVTDIAAPVFVEGALIGRADHAGATPMNLRRDPLVGLAEFILFLEQVCAARSTTVGTIGRVSVEPNMMNVIPAMCGFTIDLRDIDSEARDGVLADLKMHFDEIARTRGLESEWNVIQKVEPVTLSSSCIEILMESAEALAVPTIKMVSGAVHDAMHMAEITPTGMIFVRTRDGISHSPQEYASATDLATATEVLAGGLQMMCSVT